MKLKASSTAVTNNRALLYFLLLQLPFIKREPVSILNV